MYISTKASFEYGVLSYIFSLRMVLTYSLDKLDIKIKPSMNYFLFFSYMKLFLSYLKHSNTLLGCVCALKHKPNTAIRWDK